MKPLLIYGSQDFGRVVRDLAEQCGETFAGYVDDWNMGDEILGGYDTVHAQCPPEAFRFAVAIGYKHLRARWELTQRLLSDGYDIATLIHPRAYVRHPENIGQGAMIMAGASVEFGAHVGALGVLWNNAVVSHDSRVGENVFLAPNATLCGFTEVGAHSFIGAGAVIVDHQSVPEGSFVRAGRVYSPKTSTDPDVIRPFER